MGRVAFESGAPGELFERYPTVVLWANGQVRRVDAVAANRVVNTHSGSIPDIGSSVATVLFKWNQYFDEEYFDGEDTIGLSFITSSAARDADADAQAFTTKAGDGVYFKLAKDGLYRFAGAFKSGTIVDGQQVRIYRVVENDLDELISESSIEHDEAVDYAGLPATVGLNEIATTPPIEIASSDILYVLEGDERNASTVNRAGYLEIEYLGADGS